MANTNNTNNINNEVTDNVDTQAVELQGTEKQIRWAKDIREYRLRLYSLLQKKIKNYYSENPDNRRVQHDVETGRFEKEMLKYEKIIQLIKEEKDSEKFINEVYGWNNTRNDVEESVNSICSPTPKSAMGYIDSLGIIRDHFPEEGKEWDSQSRIWKRKN